MYFALRPISPGPKGAALTVFPLCVSEDPHGEVLPRVCFRPQWVPDRNQGTFYLLGGAIVTFFINAAVPLAHHD